MPATHEEKRIPLQKEGYDRRMGMVLLKEGYTCAWRGWCVKVDLDLNSSIKSADLQKEASPSGEPTVTIAICVTYGGASRCKDDVPRHFMTPTLLWS